MAWIDFNDPFHWVPSRGATTTPWRLAAFTFFDPRFASSKGITQLLEYLDTFSGTHLDIVISGCVKAPAIEKVTPSLVELKLGERTYYFSAELLMRDIQVIERETSWKFSGEIDVIVLRRRYISTNVSFREERDYKGAIVMNLFKMLAEKKITSYSAFFTELIHFSKDYQGDDPAWDYSDAVLWKKLKESLFESFKKFLGFRKFQIKVEDYAIRDIARAE